MLGFMSRKHAREPKPAICCRRTSPHALTAGGLAGGQAFGAGQSFVERQGWGAYRRVLAGLREFCPPATPVVVRTSWMPGSILGECIRRRHSFVIRLNNQLRQDQAIETLLHEWAHALAWNFSLDKLARMPGIDPAEFDRASHDEAWGGGAYSRVWRVYIAMF
jgi:hypothetical protein